jgi:hypothetical protein
MFRSGSLAAARPVPVAAALPPKADTAAANRRVRFGPQADSRAAAILVIICAFGRAAVNLSVRRSRNLHSQTLIALSTGRGRAPVRKGTRGDLDGSYCLEPSEVKS